MKTKKTRNVLKKGFALLLSMSLAVSAMAAAGSISASAATDTITKRGLSIGASVTDDTRFSLSADVMAKAFRSRGIPTTVYVNEDTTNASVIAQIKSAFKDSDENDINYLFTASHGNATGICMYGKNKAVIRFSDLKKTLDAIPGHFVLMISACQSGGAIGADTAQVLSEESESSSEAMMNSFLYGSPSSAVAMSDGFEDNSKYTVFCSSLSSESSWGYSGDYSFAVYCWTYAIGYDAFNHTKGKLVADVNNDGVLVPAEIQNATVARFDVLYTEGTLPEGEDQHPCYYSMFPFESVFYEDYPLGDITQDNCINNDDLERLRKYLAKWFDFTDREKQLADLNGDGDVNVLDLVLMRQYLAGGTEEA